MSKKKQPKQELVKPATLKGFQDHFPADVLKRRSVMRTIETVFERYGFVPLESPALEYADALLGAGGAEVNKELFRLESPEGESIALRFDLTVPFARMIAQYPEQLKPPFRRYAIGPVWRADKPGPGRFRQFTQMDVDVAGSPSIIADAEVIAVMCELMRDLGVTDYTVLINNRKLFDVLLADCGIDAEPQQKHVLRVIDKLAKVGLEKIRQELGDGRIDDSGDPIPGVHLEPTVIDRLLEFIAINGDTRAEVVTRLEEALPENEARADALADMRALAEALEALGINEQHARFAPSLARGLDYYTGPVFEMTLPDAPELGALMAGGRYNQLVARFSKQPIPCTGMSVGLERLLAALEHLGVLPDADRCVQVLIVSMGKVAPKDTLAIATELRTAGYRTEVFSASKKKMQMGNQLSHADRYDIPVAVILGEEEIAEGNVSIKDLRAGKAERDTIEDRDAYRAAGKTGQITVPRSSMIAEIAKLIG